MGKRENQLASYGSNTYTYDENGIRTSKTVNGVKTEYYLNGTDIIYQTDGTTSIRFICDRNSELIGFNYNNANYFYVKNGLGIITDIIDDNGNVVASYSYDPWGKVSTITGNTAIGILNPFRYKSYYYDSEIGMYYLQSRYYDPDTGRFINCDDVNYIGVTESEISYNPFAYCENEPVDGSDPEGYSSTPFSVITNLIKSLSKIVKPMSKVATILECGLKGSRYYSAIKSMKNISTTVYYEKEYDLYELYTVAQTLKWYFHERYTIITYSTTVENWYSIYDHVQKKLRNKSIADLVFSAFDIASGYVVGKYLAKSLLASAYSKLSIAAAIIGIPVGILILLASDSASKLEASLRNKKKTAIYTFNWIVGYSNQLIGQQSNSIILEYYCKWALLTGGMLV